MQLSKLKRFLKASALLMLAILTVATLTPVARAQESVFSNSRFINLPGGIGPHLPALFQLANNGLGSNVTSDVITADFNGDGFQDILAGSFTSDEVVLWVGRGNGSFVRGGTMVNPDGTPRVGTLLKEYSDVAYITGSSDSTVAALSSTGRVTSATLVINFRPEAGFSRVAVTIDYDGDRNRGGQTALIGDVVVYLDINAVGNITNATRWLPNATTSVNRASTFDANPVAITVGSVDPGSAKDIAVLCSGSRDYPLSDLGGVGGFVVVDKGANANVAANIDQWIGGGTNPNNPVVAESGQTGSLYDTRSYGNNAGTKATDGNTNIYNFGNASGNRRLFQVLPLSGPLAAYGAAGIAPRNITFGNIAHKGDGANDLAFGAVDFGSANAALPTIAAPASRKTIGEGSVFCLLNNQAAAPSAFFLRNARQLNENRDFSNGNPLKIFGQQDGVILRAGNSVAAVAVADFNKDNRLDIASANYGSGDVSAFLSGSTLEIFDSGVLSGNTIDTYPGNPLSLQVGLAPNTLYAGDTNGDGNQDLIGTNGVSAGAFAIFGTSTAGTFTGGPVIVASQPGPCRALARTLPTINGIPGGLTFGGAVDFDRENPASAGFPDIAFSRITPITSESIAVRYGTAVGAASLTYGLVDLSAFVGVVEANLNADGIPDVAICDRGTDSVIVALGGPGGFTSASRTSTFELTDLFPNSEFLGLSSIDAADVDKDGDVDLAVTADGPNDQIIVMYNTTGNFLDVNTLSLSVRPFPVGGDPTSIKFADITGPAAFNDPTATKQDGAPEAIVACRNSNTVNTLINDGRGLFGQGRSAEAAGFDPMSITVCDFNDDGKLDIACLNRGRRIINQIDESNVSILFGIGDGSFRFDGALIPVARNSVSIASAGYNVVRAGVQVDIPDVNGDGRPDIAVASELGGGPTNDVPNIAVGGNEASSFTVLLGSRTQDGKFTLPQRPQPLVDTLGVGRIAMYPGAFDVRDGRRIGYGSIALNGDFNQNGQVDAHICGAEANNGNIIVANSIAGNRMAQSFAGSITGLDNFDAAFGAARTFNVFPSLSNVSNTVSAREPVDEDTFTGISVAGSFVESNTGKIVKQTQNDFVQNPNAAPDIVQVTEIGRAYQSVNISSILNHAPMITTDKGLAVFTGPGRKVVMNEGEEVKVGLKSDDIENGVSGQNIYRIIAAPNFVTLTDNANGTATLTIKPGLTDGSNTANNGLGQAYDVAVEVNDRSFRDPLVSKMFFRVFVKDKPTAPSITNIPDQTVAATQLLNVPVQATSSTNRVIKLSTTFTNAFSTFTDNGGGTGLFSFKPQESDAGVHNVTVTATDDLGLSSNLSFKLTVTKNTAPTIGAISNVTMFEGETKEVAVTVTDPDAGQAFQTSLSGAPSFVSFQAGVGGSGTIKIAPQVGDKGSFTVTVNSTDNGIPAKTAEPVKFTITVNPKVEIKTVVFERPTGSTGNRRVFITGVGFGTAPKVFINDKDVTSKLISPITDTTLTLKGASKKELGLKKGPNAVKVIGTGNQASNIFTQVLANDGE